MYLFLALSYSPFSELGLQHHAQLFAALFYRQDWYVTCLIRNYLITCAGFKPEGLVLFLPFLALALTTLVSGRIADRVISARLLSVVNTRRVFQSLGTGTSALVLLLLVFTEVDKTTAMIYTVSNSLNRER